MLYGVRLVGPASVPPQGMVLKEARQSEGREAQSEAQGSRSCLGVPWSCDQARAVWFSGSWEPPEELRMEWAPPPLLPPLVPRNRGKPILSLQGVQGFEP